MPRALRVLVACEFSGTVRRAFAALGHDAWSCDLLPADDRSNRHIVGVARVNEVTKSAGYGSGMFEAEMAEARRAIARSKAEAPA